MNIKTISLWALISCGFLTALTEQELQSIRTAYITTLGAWDDDSEHALTAIALNQNLDNYHQLTLEQVIHAYRNGLCSLVIRESRQSSSIANLIIKLQPELSAAASARTEITTEEAERIIHIITTGYGGNDDLAEAIIGIMRTIPQPITARGLVHFATNARPPEDENFPPVLHVALSAILQEMHVLFTRRAQAIAGEPDSVPEALVSNRPSITDTIGLLNQEPSIAGQREPAASTTAQDATPLTTFDLQLLDISGCLSTRPAWIGANTVRQFKPQKIMLRELLRRVYYIDNDGILRKTSDNAEIEGVQELSTVAELSKDQAKAPYCTEEIVYKHAPECIRRYVNGSNEYPAYFFVEPATRLPLGGPRTFEDSLKHWATHGYDVITNDLPSEDLCPISCEPIWLRASDAAAFLVHFLSPSYRVFMALPDAIRTEVRNKAIGLRDTLTGSDVADCDGKLLYALSALRKVVETERTKLMN